MLDQLKVPLGYRRSIGDTHYYHVRSTLGSFWIQKINRRYTPLPCQINLRFLWDTEDQQEIHTITMLDQLKVPLGYRRSIGDTHHYHVRSTLGSFGIQKINRRYTLLPCQINFRFLWDTEDQQEIHTITMLDQLKVPLGYRRSIGDTHHYQIFGDNWARSDCWYFDSRRMRLSIHFAQTCLCVEVRNRALLRVLIDKKNSCQ